MSKEDLMIKIPKTAEGLRDALFDEINLLRRGKGNLQRARAISQLSGQVIDSLRVQIQHGRLMQLEKKGQSGGVLLGSGKVKD